MRDVLVLAAAVIMLVSAYAAGYYRGMPNFLRCRLCKARLRGLCPHCKREWRL